MKIVHHHADGCFDWLSSGHQSVNPSREVISILFGKYKRFTFVEYLIFVPLKTKHLRISARMSICQFKCPGCKAYTGKTDRCFEFKLKEHCSHQSGSAIYCHLINCEQLQFMTSLYHLPRLVIYTKFIPVQQK